MTATADRELVFAGPAELARRVRAGELAPRELVEMCLRRIEELDPQLNAFREVMAEEALAAAQQVPLDGPLAGVPIAIKDDLPLAGHVTTKGSQSYGPPADADAELVRRLRAAGAVPIGITNVPELFIFPWTASKAHGVTRNPWDPSRTTGGSSGGSAAAVASGMVPCGTAADGGGSIRVPAAACGLVGMKPTRGRVSTRPYDEIWLGLSVSGPLTRRVKDNALLLDVMHGAAAGERPLAPPSGSYVEAAERTPPRLRVAMSAKVPRPFAARLDDEVRGAWERTAEVLRGLGHEVAERDPDYGLFPIHYTQIWWRGIYEDSLTVPDPGRLESSTRQIISLGRRLVPPWRRRRLLAARERDSARIMALWDRFDVLLTPVLAKPPIEAEAALGKPAPVGIDTASRFMPFTPVCNYTGQPAIAVPAGFDRDGLPLSVQLIGRHGAEDALYSLAAQLEQAAPWSDRWPRIS